MRQRASSRILDRGQRPPALEGVHPRPEQACPAPIRVDVDPGYHRRLTSEQRGPQAVLGIEDGGGSVGDR